MKTCCICGQGYASKNEDVLIYGCISCCKGFVENQVKTQTMKKIKSVYKRMRKLAKVEES